MSFYTSTTGVSGLLPEQYNDLIVKPTREQSVAMRYGQVISIDRHSLNVPVLDTDPSAAWTAEGAEITTDDPTVSELTVTPAKLAALTVISSEMAADSSPAAQEMVGAGIARSLAKGIDAAFFAAATATNAPAGLGVLAGVNAVDGGDTWTSLDPFVDAQGNAEDFGLVVSAFVGNRETVSALSKIKVDSTASNQPVLGTDPTRAGARQIFGTPLVVSSAVADDTVYALVAPRCLVVMRKSAELAVSRDSHFTSDQVAVRGTLRVAFGFPHAAAISKITLSPA